MDDADSPTKTKAAKVAKLAPTTKATTSIGDNTIWSPDIAFEIRGFLQNKERFQMSSLGKGGQMYAPSQLRVVSRHRVSDDPARRLIQRCGGKLDSLTLAGHNQLYAMLHPPNANTFVHLRELNLTKRKGGGTVSEGALAPLVDVLSNDGMPRLTKLGVDLQPTQRTS